MKTEQTTFKVICSFGVELDKLHYDKFCNERCVVSWEDIDTNTRCNVCILEDYIVRKAQDLKSQGYHSDEIYDLLRDELGKFEDYCLAVNRGEFDERNIEELLTSLGMFY